MRYNSTSLRPVSQVMLDLPTQDSERTSIRCRAKALEWVEGHAGNRDQRTRLPKEAYRGERFELEPDTNPVSADTADGYWVVRLDEADLDVPQRTWITEIGISQVSDALVRFGCRLYCRTLGDDPTYEPTIPRVVQSVADSLHAEIDGQLVKPVAWKIHDTESVEELVGLLCTPTRQLSVIAVTSPPNDGFLSLNPDYLARSLIGVAHVCLLTEDASFLMTDLLGKPHSVFGGAIRT